MEQTICQSCAMPLTADDRIIASGAITRGSFWMSARWKNISKSVRNLASRLG